MKMKKLCVATAFAFASMAAVADYQGELGAAYSKTSFDSDFDVDVDVLSLFGQFHFSPVKTDTHPLAEAAFLERSNNISAIYAQADWESVDEELLTGQVELYIPQAMLYLAPFYEYTSFDGGDEFEGSENDWGVIAGLTPMEGFRVTTTWSDEIDYELNFDVKYVLKLANDTAVNLEFGYAEAAEAEDEFEEEGDDVVTAAIDYYLDRTFSIGFEIEDAGETAYGVRTQKFFTESFNAFAGYQTSDEVDTWILGASFRF